MAEWINTVDQGTAVEVRTAGGEWIAAVADSRVEGTHDGHRRIHDFPIIWVRVDDARIPWPLADIRPAEGI